MKSFFSLLSCYDVFLCKKKSGRGKLLYDEAFGEFFLCGDNIDDIGAAGERDEVNGQGLVGEVLVATPYLTSSEVCDTNVDFASKPWQRDADFAGSWVGRENYLRSAG